MWLIDAALVSIHPERAILRCSGLQFLSSENKVPGTRQKGGVTSQFSTSTLSGDSDWKNQVVMPVTLATDHVTLVIFLNQPEAAGRLFLSQSCTACREQGASDSTSQFFTRTLGQPAGTRISVQFHPALADLCKTLV